MREPPLSTLPAIPTPSRADHVWFELTGGHAAAVGVLRRQLGLARMTRALAGLGRRQLLEDPFAALPPAQDTADWLTRRQLAPVLLLEDTLRDDLGLGTDATRAVLADLIGTVGARLLGRRFPALTEEAWAAAPADTRERMARRVFARLGNIASADVHTTDTTLALEVTACRFVSLLRQVDRPHLGTLFCEADAVFFERPDAPVSLTRTTTLARGGPACDFLFRLRP